MIFQLELFSWGQELNKRVNKILLTYTFWTQVTWLLFWHCIFCRKFGKTSQFARFNGVSVWKRLILRIETPGEMQFNIWIDVRNNAETTEEGDEMNEG